MGDETPARRAGDGDWGIEKEVDLIQEAIMVEEAYKSLERLHNLPQPNAHIQAQH